MKVVTVEQAGNLVKGAAQQLDAKKVEKRAGRDLSTNDYTTIEKEKLAGIASNAGNNVIEVIKVNNVAVSIVGKAANIDLSNYATKADISSVYKTKGSKANIAALPTSGNVTGDVWNLTDTGANYVWTGSVWDKLSETIDLSAYATKKDLETATGVIEEATETDITNILNGLFIS